MPRQSRDTLKRPYFAIWKDDYSWWSSLLSSSTKFPRLISPMLTASLKKVVTLQKSYGIFQEALQPFHRFLEQLRVLLLLAMKTSSNHKKIYRALVKFEELW